MLTRLPSGPSGSTIAGILLFGLMARKSGAICSPLVMLIGMTLYGSSISSSATLILRPFGVFQVCSSMVIFVILRESRVSSTPKRLGLTTGLSEYWIVRFRGRGTIGLLTADFRSGMSG